MPLFLKGFRSIVILLAVIIAPCISSSQTLVFNSAYAVYSSYLDILKMYTPAATEPYNQYFLLDTVTKTLKHSTNYPGDQDDLRADAIVYDAAAHQYICTLHPNKDKNIRYARAYCRLGANGQPG